MPVVASYPTNIPSFITKVDGVDTVWADHVNILQAEVVAIATALGTVPQGTSASVKQRMADIEAMHTQIESHFNANGNVPQAGVEGLPATLAGLIPYSLITTKGDLLAGSAPATAVRVPIGSNGYVLTADSGAAGGVSWDPLPLSNTIVDAKGDLIVGTAPDTIARLAVGTDGYALVANSGVTDGVAWQAVHFPIPFHFANTLTTGVKAPSFIAPRNATLLLAQARCASGSGAQFQVYVNGASVTSTSPVVGGTVVMHDFTDVPINAGDYVQIDIIAAGTGADMSVTLDAIWR